MKYAYQPWNILWLVREGWASNASKGSIHCFFHILLIAALCSSGFSKIATKPTWSPNKRHLAQIIQILGCHFSACHCFVLLPFFVSHVFLPRIIRLSWSKPTSSCQNFGNYLSLGYLKGGSRSSSIFISISFVIMQINYSHSAQFIPVPKFNLNVKIWTEHFTSRSTQIQYKLKKKHTTWKHKIVTQQTAAIKPGKHRIYERTQKGKQVANYVCSQALWNVQTINIETCPKIKIKRCQ